MAGHQVLDSLNDDEAAASLADTLLRHGRKLGAEILQNAINDAYRTASGKADGPLTVDGKMGPETLEQYKSLLSDPGTRVVLLETLGHVRTKYEPKESKRADHFRYRKSSESR